MNVQQVVKFLSANKVIIELILVAIVAASVWMNANGVGGGADLLMISMSTLAGFYYFSAFFMVEITGKFVAIGLKVFSIASAVCVLGLLFTILRLAGASELLMIGITAMGASGLILVYYAMTTWNKEYLFLFLRIALIGSIAVSTWITLEGSN